MFLKRAILVNWGNIPVLETAFEFGPINLFSGGNGSGKTTAADAIQTLMTAAHENLFNYNPGQDETTQRGRGGKQVRTLASYVLGCDDGSYARMAPTDAYIAGVFHPTQGESGEAFTAVMCMRAHLDKAGNQRQARLSELNFIIIAGEQLNQNHFVKKYSDGRHVVPIDKITSLLKQEFGAKAVEVYDKKGAYLRRLYAAFRGRKDAVNDREAKHAARTFSNFMAYKPVKSINEFVAREILEPKDLGDAIRNVSELMKTIHKMESDTKDICQSIDILSTAKTLSQDYVNIWIEGRSLQYCEASRQLKTTQQKYLSAKSEQKHSRQKLAELEQKLGECQQQSQQTQRQIVELYAQRQGIKALKDKDLLEQQITEGNQALQALNLPLLEQDRQFKSNARAAGELLNRLNKSSLGALIPLLSSKNTRKLLKSVADSEQDLGIDASQLMVKDWIDISPLETYLEKISLAEQQHKQLQELLFEGENDKPMAGSEPTNLRDQVAMLHASTERKCKDINAKMQQKQKEIALLQAQKVSYPAYVEQALNAIKKQCPEADPRVLCDYIEVLDPHWQMAIEGYIGGARFSIIVDSDYEAKAISIVRNLPDARRNRARVIQGYKAQRDAERISLPRDSIIEVMEFQHKTAEYYLKASYGSVLRVDDAETLRTTARGITPEGLGSGNYSMWRCDLQDGELVFGQGARERAMAAKERECEALLEEANSAWQEQQSYGEILSSISSIKSLNAAALAQKMLKEHRAIEAAEAALQRLDLSDFKELEQQLELTQQEYDQLQIQYRQLGEESGKLKERETRNNKEVKELADKIEGLQEEQDQCEQGLRAIAKSYPAFEPDQALSDADKKAELGGDNFDFAQDLQELLNRMEQCERKLYQTVLDHNQCCQHPSDAIVYDVGFDQRHSEEFFQRQIKLGRELELIHNRLKNNVLVDKFEQLGKLRDSFNTAFVTNLCHSIYQAIGDGKRILDDLNLELEHHRFGADKERFYFGYDWVPEFRDYWRFFKEVIDIPNLGDGTSLFEAELSDKAAQVRDKMLNMLLDPDEQIALRELNRVSDYRNYRQYEIYKEPDGKAPIALSQYGTGSGGQLETPAYIIRSAAVTSAFRFNEGNTHLRMVLVDEAFSKMDETRSREVIHYLTNTLGLQLVFIMPTSKSGPFMDLISNQFVYSKCPTDSPVGELKTRVLVDRKECNQDKIKALWAKHRKTIRHQGMLDFMEGL